MAPYAIAKPEMVCAAALVLTANPEAKAGKTESQARMEAMLAKPANPMAINWARKDDSVADTAPTNPRPRL
jgi:hypothetical protein